MKLLTLLLLVATLAIPGLTAAAGSDNNPETAEHVDLAAEHATKNCNDCRNYYDKCYVKECDPRDFHQVDCRAKARKKCACKTYKSAGACQLCEWKCR